MKTELEEVQRLLAMANLRETVMEDYFEVDMKSMYNGIKGEAMSEETWFYLQCMRHEHVNKAMINLERAQDLVDEDKEDE